MKKKNEKKPRHLFIPIYTSIRAIGFSTKTEDLNNPTVYRNNSRYWRKRLITKNPTHFYKFNKHGPKSSIFKIIHLEVVDSPRMYLDEGVLHTKKAILIVGEEIKE